MFSPFYSVGDGAGNPLSLIICFIPRILVGIVPYFVYIGLKKLMKQRKGGETLSLTIAGLAGSLVNTLLVMNLIYFLFGDSYAAAKGVKVDTLYKVILTVIGINGVPEAILAAILTVAICQGTVQGTETENRSIMIRKGMDTI